MSLAKYFPAIALVISAILLALVAVDVEYFKLGRIRKGSCTSLEATSQFAPIGTKWKSGSHCIKKNPRGQCIEYECETVDHPNDE